MTATIGVDIGGTKMLAGIVGADGEVLATVRRPTPRQSPDSVVDEVAQMCAELTHAHPAQAIGVGVAGLVDADRSRVLLAPNLGWADVRLGDRIAIATGLPTVVENDGNAAAWGEFRFGAGRDLDEMIAVTVGTGIGGGIVLSGRLRRGAHGVGAEIGHVTAKPDGRPCGCGRRGCWEQYASGNALVREARRQSAERRAEAALLLSLGDGTPEGVAGVHVTEAARLGDPVARDAFAVIGTWLGRGMADLTAVLDPTAFVIGGGVSEAGDLLLDSARATLAELAIGGSLREVPQVRAATLGNDAGLVGAADLARHPD